MRAVVSTVATASVVVDGEVVGHVDADRDGAGRGALLALVGAGRDDDPEAWATVARKIAELRILPSAGESWESGRDVSAQDNGAEVLVVSQFTLMGATAKGRRPSWSPAAPGEQAAEVLEKIVDDLRSRGMRVETGRFGAMMEVSSTNLGPYTLIIEA
ncbi:MAG TPA: D-tyrosyl-tRNA(Tyr) deacylase [Candidatus Corynebacterium faecigallinarum]|uniref:D-aminoacyl-tRNA deacylase n=1 Tax=Candidatus Corynebacterium faecigallinarum TaxID=2838528 RepID=A0A9D2QBA8_9CORY|nr:D-tyrosyl-tRNA(Tyr) deacylase [Candidatus Corynebacterium faecigallinarum]